MVNRSISTTIDNKKRNSKESYDDNTTINVADHSLVDWEDERINVADQSLVDWENERINVADQSLVEPENERINVVDRSLVEPENERINVADQSLVEPENERINVVDRSLVYWENERINVVDRSLVQFYKLNFPSQYSTNASKSSYKLSAFSSAVGNVVKCVSKFFVVHKPLLNTSLRVMKEILVSLLFF
jgi:DNA-binding XRE family transcriptional regulator